MSDSATDETIGLLGLARAQGKGDVYMGKRRWARYSLGMQIEATTDPSVPSAAWPVIMHNISGGGIGFWSKRELPINSKVHILDHTDAHSPKWIPSRVSHCSVGLRGYLIGASFDKPAPHEESPDTTPEPVIEESRDQAIPRGPTTIIRSLLARNAAALALACTMAAAAVLILVPYGSLRGNWVAQAALLGGGVAALGACYGWVTLLGEVRFLNALQAEVRRLAMGVDAPSQLPEAPSKELAGVRRAFLDLEARWRKREEDDRVQRQKLEEITRIKSNILSIVSHDMRTPLTSILLYTEMLRDDLNTLAEEDQRNFLKIIVDECTRLSRLVDDLLEVQRLESGRVRWNLEQQDLSATVRASARVFEAMAISKSIDFVVHCPESLPPVVADADKISQVLSNLLANAFKYTPAGGKVEISAEARGAEIVLCVLDNGPGIPREKWDQIFDRFAQLSDPDVGESGLGAGLGLYIVRKIVDAHGGAAWVNSEVGQGSEFYVTLPTRSSGTKPNTEPGPCAGSVLICDSDSELAATMAQTLTAEDFDVRVAHSGERLLAQLEHADVDVVITDLSMPDMGAQELIGALNSISDRSFRTIIHSYEGDGRELTRKGVDAFLRRPVSRADLVKAVHVALQKGSAAGLTVLMLDTSSIDVTRLEDLLQEAGHTTVVAGTMKEAVGLAGDYAIDLILLSSESLTARWAELEGFEITAADATRVLVLCDTVRKNERRLEEMHGVTVVPYRPGNEESVVDAMMTSRDVPTMEYTQ